MEYVAGHVCVPPLQDEVEEWRQDECKHSGCQATHQGEAQFKMADPCGNCPGYQHYEGTQAEGHNQSL